MDLNQGVLHLLSKFGGSKLNRWWVIMQTSWWLTDTQTDAGDDNTQRPKLASGKKTQHEIHLLKLVDKMCKYEMDLAIIVVDTHRVDIVWSSDGWTDGQSGKSIPPTQLLWHWGISRWKIHYNASPPRCCQFQSIRHLLLYGVSR